MKKILFIIHDLSVGGAEKVLVNLVNNMDSKQFDITVLALFGGGVNEQFLNTNIRYLTLFKKSFRGNSKLMKLFSPKVLHKLIIKEKYDIEVSYLEGPSARIVSGCNNAGTKLVSWIHSVQHTKRNASKAFRSFKESEECYSKFHEIVCVSEFVKRDFMQVYPKIKNVSVKYNTNETEQILRQKKEDVEAGLFNPDEFAICGVGKIAPIKGFDKLARIHTRLRKEGYPIHTYILGVGPEKDSIEKYIKDNMMQKSFTFLGYQTNPYKYVEKCDLFVCSSVSEGFSTAATEALIIGTPVVTTAVSGMEEMLGKNNEYGIIVDNNEEALYNGIKKMLDDRKMLLHYKKMAEERGLLFSTENTVKMVEEMLLAL